MAAVPCRWRRGARPAASLLVAAAVLAFAAAAGAAAGPPPPPPGVKGFELVLGTNRTIGAGGQHFHPLPPGKKRVCILDFDDTIKVGAGDVAADAQAVMDRCLAMGYEAKRSRS